MRRHRQFARGKQPPARRPDGGARRAQRESRVAAGIGRRQGRRIDVVGARHAKRPEDPLAQEFEQGLARLALGDHAGDDVAGVAVLPGLPGRKIQRLVRPPRDDLPRRHRGQHVGEHVILRPIVANAGGVRQQGTNARAGRRPETGEVFAGGVVDRQAARVPELQQCGRREFLADRTHRIAHGTGRGAGGIDLRPAIGLRIDDASIANDCDRGGRNAGPFDRLPYGGVHLGAQRPADRGVGHGRVMHHAQCEEQAASDHRGAPVGKSAHHATGRRPRARPPRPPAAGSRGHS